MVLFASAAFGMADALTDRVGVVVDVATEGTSQVGQLPELAMKFVTDPPPEPDPVKLQVVPVQEPAPAEKLKVNPPLCPLIENTQPVFDMFPEESIWRQSVPEPAAAPVSTRDVNFPAAGVVPPIAAGEARYVARFVHVGATAAEDDTTSLMTYVPFVVWGARPENVLFVPEAE